MKQTVKMIDVSSKPPVLREAIAEGEIFLSKKTILKIKKGRIPKGDVLVSARVAGIMAAKKTSELIPLCHPLPIEHTEVDLRVKPDRIMITAKSKIIGKTGVEMESLCAVTVASLCIYDMCKSIDKNMKISNIRLIKKSKQFFPGNNG